MHIDTIFFIAEIILLASYITSSMMTLRIIVCISQIGLMIGSYRAGVAAPGMKATLIFSSLTFIINGIHITRLLYAKIPIILPAKYQSVYEKEFAEFTSREFLILISYSEEKKIKNDYLIRENTFSDVSVIISGQVQISVGNKSIVNLEGHHIVGEISFLTNSASIAAVKAIGEVNICTWTHAKLQKLEKKYPQIFYKFDKVLLNSFAVKLVGQNKKNVI